MCPPQPKRHSRLGPTGVRDLDLSLTGHPRRDHSEGPENPRSKLTSRVSDDPGKGPETPFGTPNLHPGAAQRYAAQEMSSDRSPADRNARRVLLVGNERFDTPIDSFRRALSDHYEVCVADPFNMLGAARRILSQPLAARLESRVTLLASLFTGEPLALAERRLRRIAADFAPDIALVACGPLLRPSAVASLRAGNADCRVLSVYPDHLANFGRGYFFAADYDRLFFKDATSSKTSAASSAGATSTTFHSPATGLCTGKYLSATPTGTSTAAT